MSPIRRVCPSNPSLSLSRSRFINVYRTSLTRTRWDLSANSAARYFLKSTPAEMHLPRRKSPFKRRREAKSRARARAGLNRRRGIILSACAVARYVVLQFSLLSHNSSSQSPLALPNLRHSLFLAVLSHLPERPAIVGRIYDPLRQRRREREREREMARSIELDRCRPALMIVN